MSRPTSLRTRLAKARLSAPTAAALGSLLVGPPKRFHAGPIQSVLVIRLDEIGDVILTSPLLRELRRAYPAARITLMVKPLTVALVEHCPYIDELIIQAPCPRESCLTVGNVIRALRVARSELRDRRFDIALVPRWDVDYYRGPYLAWLSRAPNRIGYSETVTPRKAAANRGFDRFLTRAVLTNGVKHEVVRTLAILEELGQRASEERLEAWLTDNDHRIAASVVANSSKPGTALVALCPGAGAAERRWPPERFVALAAALRTYRPVAFVVVGGPDEHALGEEIVHRIEPLAINATDLTLRAMGALLARCDLYVGNDTGPMHAAASVGTPVVEICCHGKNADEAHTFSPRRFGPWGAPSTIVRPAHALAGCERGCAAGDSHCILEVSVEQVCLAAAAMLDAIPRYPRGNTDTIPRR